MFSATFPHDIQKMAHDFMHEYVFLVRCAPLQHCASDSITAV